MKNKRNGYFILILSVLSIFKFTAFAEEKEKYTIDVKFENNIGMTKYMEVESIVKSNQKIISNSGKIYEDAVIYSKLLLQYSIEILSIDEDGLPLNCKVIFEKSSYSEDSNEATTMYFVLNKPYYLKRIKNKNILFYNTEEITSPIVKNIVPLISKSLNLKIDTISNICVGESRQIENEYVNENMLKKYKILSKESSISLLSIDKNQKSNLQNFLIRKTNKFKSIDKLNKISNNSVHFDFEEIFDITIERDSKIKLETKQLRTETQKSEGVFPEYSKSESLVYEDICKYETTVKYNLGKTK